jgi:DNA-binding NtrC family response regulator
MPLVQQDGVLYLPVKTRPDLVRPLHLVTREIIESALILCGGNRKEAARRLGISRETIQRRIAEFRAEDGDA